MPNALSLSASEMHIYFLYLESHLTTKPQSSAAHAQHLSDLILGRRSAGSMSSAPYTALEIAK